MSALAEIQREIDRLKREGRTPYVRVGISAQQSILATTGDDTVPETIDDVPVYLTTDFSGWEVSE